MRRLIEKIEDKIIKSVGIGCLLIGAGFGAIAIGGNNNEDWKIKGTGYALTILGGATCVFWPQYIISKERKKIKNEFRKSLEKYSDYLNN